MLTRFIAIKWLPIHALKEGSEKLVHETSLYVSTIVGMKVFKQVGLSKNVFLIVWCMLISIPSHFSFAHCTGCLYFL